MKRAGAEASEAIRQTAVLAQDMRKQQQSA